MKANIIFLITAFILLVSIQYFGIKNRRVQREQQTSRYIATQPIEDLMQELTKRMAKNIPVDQRQKFKDFMINNVDVVSLENIMKISMQKKFKKRITKRLLNACHNTMWF